MSAAGERLRHEVETFDLQKAHADRQLVWRLVANPTPTTNHRWSLDDVWQAAVGYCVRLKLAN